MPRLPRHVTPVCILLVICSFGTASSIAGGAEELAKYHQTIKQEFESVDHINAEQLATLKEGAVLFDVREDNEFRVSHLEGAIRVSPDITQKDFVQRFANLVKGKPIVFYCSVGYRSSKLATTVQENLRVSGSQEIYNLEGGIFNWHNERRKLVNKNGPSDDIHPYDRYWGRLLERPKMIRYHAN